MILVTKENIRPRFEFFKKVCIEECLNYLRHSIPDAVIIHTVKNDDDNCQLLEESGGALCAIKYNKDVLFCHIHISENILEFNNIYYPGERDRRENFLNSLEVPINEYTLFLIVLLHEFGHANLIKLFYDAGIVHEYNIFDSLSESTSNIFERRRETLTKWEDYHNNNELPQMVNGVESQCDIFARDNFLPLWKIINKSLKNYTIGGDIKSKI
jgi:hypothetical protein